MIFLTWNLHKTDRAFRLVLEHLAGLSGEFLAAFQELPPNAASTENARKLVAAVTKNAVRCLGVVGSSRAPGRIGLFASAGISAVGAITSDAKKRMAMTVLKSKTWSELGVVAYHAVDRRNVPREFARGALTLLSRQQIEAF